MPGESRVFQIRDNFVAHASRGWARGNEGEKRDNEKLLSYFRSQSDCLEFGHFGFSWIWHLISSARSIPKSVR